ncbi:hypothetical protein GCM10027294_35120 [Marinactinospora endophytica]
MDVQQDEIRDLFGDDPYRAVDVAGLTDDLDRVPEFATHAAAEQTVVVHDHDARGRAAGKGVLVSHTLDSTHRARG